MQNFVVMFRESNPQAGMTFLRELVGPDRQIRDYGDWAAVELTEAEAQACLAETDWKKGPDGVFESFGPDRVVGIA